MTGPGGASAMTVWEKTLVNLQTGYSKLTVFAATFSERVRAEINIIRLRMQIDALQRSIRGQQQLIGRKLLELRENSGLPRTFELFFRDSEVSAAVEQIERLNKDREILLDDLQNEAEALKSAPAKQEERSA